MTRILDRYVLREILRNVAGVTPVLLIILVGTQFARVLDAILYAYAFMVSGLLVPVLAALFTKNPSSIAALLAMLGGGVTTSLLVFLKLPLPLVLDAYIFVIFFSFLFYIITYRITSYLRTSGTP